MTLPLQCNWTYPPIDINGLNESDQKRIKEIGLDAWLEEVSMTDATKELRKKFTAGVKEVEKTTTEETTKPTPTTQSVGKKGMFLAEEFLKAARANNGVVTREMALKIDSKYPGDPAYYARLMGYDIETDKKNHRWILKEKVNEQSQ